MQERLISLNMKVNLKVVHDTLNMFFKLLYLYSNNEEDRNVRNAFEENDNNLLISMIQVSRIH